MAILSRGYRGTNGTSDEIEMMKQRLKGRVVFGVGPDRYEEGRRIEKQETVDVFLLDDGFQHIQLARDVDVLMLDGSKQLRRQWLIPAGVLREPIAACNRADLIVVTRKQERPDIQVRDSHEHYTFYAQTRLLGMRKLGEAGTLIHVNEMGQRPFLAFCGIGNPQAFFKGLESWNVPVAGQKAFRDHHRYSEADVGLLERSATAIGAKALITTEKDEQNLRGRKFATLPVYVAVIDFVLPEESEFCATLEGVLKARRKPA